jgi:hypothetical protein
MVTVLLKRIHECRLTRQDTLGFSVYGYIKLSFEQYQQLSELMDVGEELVLPLAQLISQLGLV